MINCFVSKKERICVFSASNNYAIYSWRKLVLFIALIQKASLDSSVKRPHPSFTIQDIMAAILKTAGPVSTTDAVRYTKMSLHHITAADFDDAACELQKAHLGSLVTVPSERNKGHNVFIKKLPSEIEPALAAHPDLCSVELYATRFAKAAPKAIKFPLRARLVALKLVSQNVFM